MSPYPLWLYALSWTALAIAGLSALVILADVIRAPRESRCGRDADDVTARRTRSQDGLVRHPWTGAGEETASASGDCRPERAAEAGDGRLADPGLIGDGSDG